MLYVSLYFFFFKQETADDVLISDWSSDVCSSDLSLELLDVVGKLIVSGLGARSDRGFRMRRHARILTDFAPPEMALRQADSGMRPTAHVTVWALAEHARATSPTLRPAPRLAPPTASSPRLPGVANGTQIGRATG